MKSYITILQIILTSEFFRYLAFASNLTTHKTKFQQRCVCFWAIHLQSRLQAVWCSFQADVYITRCIFPWRGFFLYCCWGRAGCWSISWCGLTCSFIDSSSGYLWWTLWLWISLLLMIKFIILTGQSCHLLSYILLMWFQFWESHERLLSLPFISNTFTVTRLLSVPFLLLVLIITLGTLFLR